GHCAAWRARNPSYKPLQPLISSIVQQHRVEAQMNRLKLFGERIMSRDPDGQTAEIQIRIIRHCRSDQWRDMTHS
ncbi:hypothetical protein LZ188_24000, partial [Rhodovulum sulfidophilum]|nr:hypothetical protein [Rhodovulum sulfidophilum]